MSTVSVYVVVWGEPQHIITDDSVALQRLADIAFPMAGIAGRYRDSLEWEFRTYEGRLLEMHRSLASYQVGNNARFFLSPRAGIAA